MCNQKPRYVPSKPAGSAKKYEPKGRLSSPYEPRLLPPYGPICRERDPEAGPYDASGAAFKR